jgi:uncharacterized membrane protein YphA (DoxX/SURF4 family)
VSIFDLWKYWKQFWFRSESPLGISIFRIIYGLIVLEYCLLLYPDLLNWFGQHGICSLDSSRKMFAFLGPLGLNVFDWLPSGDTTIIVVFWLLVIAAICLTIGLFTNVSALFVFVILASLQQQDGLIVQGGHILLKMIGFYLIFAPCGYYFSCDRLLKMKRQPASAPDEASPSGWPQRMLRFFIAFVYFQAFWCKLDDNKWVDGTAIYYVLHENEFLRFPVTWIANNLPLCQALTWGTLAIECAMWSLIWFKETRYFVICAALLLHLGIEYTMNLPLFESLMIASLIVFVPAEDIKKAYDKLAIARILRRGNAGSV